MDAFYQATFSNAFYSMESDMFPIEISLKYVPNAPLSNNQTCFTDAYFRHSASLS